MNIYKHHIDYELINSFGLEKLKKDLKIPFSKTGIYVNCFTYSNSHDDSLNLKSLEKVFEVKRSEIEFFLDNFTMSFNLFKYLKESKLKEFFTSLLKEARNKNASDIHIEAGLSDFIIRFRIDGTLKIFHSFEKEYFYSVSSYFKMQAKLDITQTRLPQDGRFNALLDDKKFDFRVSTMPTINAESIVIRVLDNENVSKNLEQLGFSFHVKNKFKDICSLTQGLVLVTGPTGSGKTTTLYSLLKKFDSENKKIITVEDPVEYKIPSIQQVLVNNEIGLSFDTILKNILRQDPDIILVGEIRDKKSLDIALQASLTGHLVLASIHANNSLETITRLIDLDADLYLLVNSLKYILSQRLVLNICKACEKKGCSKCNFTGFKGRSSISELLTIDEKLSTMILKKEDFSTINNHLVKNGFLSLKDDGKLKVEEGITTYEEVLKVLSF